MKHFHVGVLHLLLIVLVCNISTYAQLTGELNPYVISSRFSTNAAGYFPTERLQNAKTFYEVYHSTYNGDPATTPLTNLLSYAAGSNTAQVYVPIDYEHEKPVGLFIYISSGDALGNLNAYFPAFDDKYIIGAAPANVGNNQPDMLRISHSLDLMTTLTETYNIDPERIYLSGLSGGTVPAMLMTLMYPELFAGVIGEVRVCVPNAEHDFFTIEEVEEVAELYSHRMTFTTGSNDFNYAHVLSSAPWWRSRGYPVRIFDVPGMGHAKCSLSTFTETLGWLDNEHHTRRSDTYSEWSFFQFDELEQAQYLPDADYDLDTISNLDEYIFGSDPHDPLSKPQGMNISMSNEVNVSYVCRSSLADYRIEVGVSTNLIDWDYSHSNLVAQGRQSAGNDRSELNFSPSGSMLDDYGYFKLRLQEAPDNTHIVDVFAAANHNYGVSTIATMSSAVLTASDGLATFQVAFDVHPTTGKSVRSGYGGGNATSQSWGVASTGEAAKALYNFNGDAGDSIDLVDNLRVINFNANGGGLSLADISDLSFASVTIVNGQSTQDRVVTGVNGITYNEAGSKMPSNLYAIDLQLLAGSTPATNFSLGVGNAQTTDKWSVFSVQVKYTALDNL